MANPSGNPPPDPDDNESVNTAASDTSFQSAYSDPANEPEPTEGTFMPVKPRNGGLIQTGLKEFTAWTGGKPRPEGKGLAHPNKSYLGIDQHRPLTTKGQGAQAIRRKGLETKFTRTSNRDQFATTVQRHLAIHGMDPIAYLQQDGAERLVHICEKYLDYGTLKVVKVKAELQAKNNDNYDDQNNRDACMFLLDSLEASFRTDVEQQLADPQKLELFPVLFKRIMDLTGIRSREGIETLRQKLHSLDPTKYPGHDMNAFGRDILAIAAPLDNAGELHPASTLNVIRNACRAGGDQSTDNRGQKMFEKVADKFYDRLEDFLHEKRNVTGSKLCKLVAQAELSLKDLVYALITEQQRIHELGLWLPMKNLRAGAAGVPNTFGAHVLMQNQPPPSSSGDRSSDTCNNCGEKGHWARDCTKPPRNSRRHQTPSRSSKKQGRGGGRSSGGGGRGSDRGNGANGGRPNNRRNNKKNDEWRRVKPVGDQKEKQVDGITHYWCAHCERWQLTHGTAGHTNTKTMKPQAAANIGLVSDPFDWVPHGFCAEVSSASPVPAKTSFKGALVSLVAAASLVHLAVAHGVVQASIQVLLRLVGGLPSVQPLASQLGQLLASVGDVNIAFGAFVGDFGSWLVENPLASMFLLVNVVVFAVCHHYKARSKRSPKLHRPTRRKRPHVARFIRQQVSAPIITASLHPNVPRHRRRRNTTRKEVVSQAARRHDIEHLNDLTQRIEDFAKRITFYRSARTPFHVGGDRDPTAPAPSKRRPKKPKPLPTRQPFRQSVFDSSEKKRSRAARLKYSCGFDPTPQQEELLDNYGAAFIATLDEEEQSRIPTWILEAFKTGKESTSSPEEPKEASKRKVIWDSGASISISPSRDDFVGPISSVPSTARINGLLKGAKIAGKGYVAWSFIDKTGMLRTVKLPAYYLPQAKVRLLSTTSLLQHYPSESIHQNDKGLYLSGSQTGPLPWDGVRTNGIDVLVDPSTNLPTALAYDPNIAPRAQAFRAAGSQGPSGGPPTPSGSSGGPPPPFAPSETPVTVSSNENLTEAEKELIRWHCKLGHLSFAKIQFLMRTGVLAATESQRRLHIACSRLQHSPLCAGCQFAKQKLRSSPGKTSHIVKDRDGVMSRDKLLPGQRVSIDHFICKTKGRLFTSRGKSKDADLYSGGCIFVDHATGFIHVEFQRYVSTDESLAAKEAFELLCRDFGIVPQEYQADNGAAFTSAGFAKHLFERDQRIRHAGVGAHHHNGVAERAIQTIMSIARAMMLHSALHWSPVADPALWPMAVRHAVYIWNRMPNVKTGLSPIDVFTRTRWPQHRFHDLHVWGCPVYVLDKTIADGHKLPRWQPRSQRSMYMGMSESHSSSVPLVLNLTTGAITPQFHVVFDDWFATVASPTGSLPDFNSDEWKQLFDVAQQHIPTEEDDDPDVQVVSAEENAQREAQRVHDAFARQAPTLPLAVAEPAAPAVAPSAAASPTPSSETSPSKSRQVWESPLPSSVTNPRQGGEPAPSPSSTPAPPSTPVPSTNESRGEPTTPTSPAPAPSPAPALTSPAPEEGLRRSSRTRVAPTRYGFDGSQGDHGYMAHFAPVYAAFRIPAPVVYKAAASDPDTLSYEQAMNDRPSVEEWLKAADAEIRSLEAKGTWIEVPKLEAKTRILPGTWVFRRKRAPDGRIKKYKGRYCVRGDLQEGEFDTFAPVVQWSTIRLILVLSLTLDWPACSIDFASAFVQAKLSEPVWIHLPRGFRSNKGSDTCLRLLKSLYGLSVAPRLWYEHLRDALLKLGLRQSAYDPCLFYGPDLIFAYYVDDALLCSRTTKIAEAFIAKLKAAGFELTLEETLCEYLGIKFERNDKNGTYTLSQPGLIDKIVAATGLVDSKPNAVPAALVALGSDPEGDVMRETWSYPSVVGMLLYLSTNTRPDIAYAVSQVARFNSNPKQSHAAAIKTIVRYLHGSRDKGTIMKPSNSLELDLYCDADFAGLFRREPDNVPDAVRSRTGYIILLAGCPLIWKSQLQTEISMSTLEAEYSALSYSLKALLPIKRILIEAVAVLSLPSELTTSVRARVFEDNQGCYYLATNQRITNRTKYFLVKYHWFWDLQRREEILIYKVDTHNQSADFLTKGLARDLFERNRLKVQGW